MRLLVKSPHDRQLTMLWCRYSVTMPPPAAICSADSGSALEGKGHGASACSRRRCRSRRTSPVSTMPYPTRGRARGRRRATSRWACESRKEERRSTVEEEKKSQRRTFDHDEGEVVERPLELCAEGQALDVHARGQRGQHLVDPVGHVVLRPVRSQGANGARRVGSGSARASSEVSGRGRLLCAVCVPRCPPARPLGAQTLAVSRGEQKRFPGKAGRRPGARPGARAGRAHPPDARTRAAHLQRVGDAVLDAALDLLVEQRHDGLGGSGSRAARGRVGCPQTARARRGYGQGSPGLQTAQTVQPDLASQRLTALLMPCPSVGGPPIPFASPARAPGRASRR